MMVLGVNDATSFTFGDKLTSIHNYQVPFFFLFQCELWWPNWNETDFAVGRIYPEAATVKNEVPSEFCLHYFSGSFYW